MKSSRLFLLLLAFPPVGADAQERETLYLWPGAVPGEEEAKHPPVVTQNQEGNTTRLTDVTNPALIVFDPDPSVRNGAGVVVSPGGAYNILAIDKEGYEVAEWLNSLGFTAFVLQYRVPQKQEGALQDIQRAIRIIRSEASRWDIQADRVGVLGFSAGGSLSARASARYAERTYPPVDARDSLSARPAFALLIYPAYLDQGEGRSLTAELTVDENTPPTFLFATADDRYANSSLVMTAALLDAQVPVELHLLPAGGHGYGLRPGNPAAESWPALAEIWLREVVETDHADR